VVATLYEVEALDLILANAGGYSAVIWQFFGIFFSWYAAFRFEASLGNELYQADKKYRKKKQIDNKMELAECIANRREFHFVFFETFFLKCTNMFQCCCPKKPCMVKRRLRGEAYDAIKERYQEETDVVKMIKSRRVSNFMSKTLLKSSQRALI
jgi:hypothetical protein